MKIDQMPRRAGRVAMEGLESRCLLSAVLETPGLPLLISPSIPVSMPMAAQGVTLNEFAGVPFTATVGVITGIPRAGNGYHFQASIDWGDGTADSAGHVAVNAAGRLEVQGSHTYAAAGTDAITVRVTEIPPSPAGGPISDPLLIVIHSTAIVSQNSAGGVTLYETAGSTFTAVVGSFSSIAPGTNLSANIDWGDGSESAGTIQATGVSGIDVIDFDVLGTHDYNKPGTYAMQIVITQGYPGTASPIFLVTTIDSTAIVTAGPTAV